MSRWETLDVEALLSRQEEQTTSAGVGAYPVPLGRPLRRQFPVSAPQYKTLRQGSPADPEDEEYRWALGMVRATR